MKSLYSSTWVSSVQKRKQKKYIANSPLHKKHKFLSANLSSDLRKKYGKRNLPLRKGDEVLVMRGSFKKKKAKVVSVNLRSSNVFLENLQRSKKDGTKTNIPFSPSNLQIISLNTEDKMRGLVSSKSTAQSKEKENASN